MEPIDIAVKAAHQAGELILQHFHRPLAISAKGPADIVTQADRDAEDMIVHTIGCAFPSHEFLGEESHKAAAEAKYLWIIDPLDGTRNYAMGIPFFCTSIALAVNGQIMLGVIHDVVHRETFTAERGKGAYLNGQRIEFARKAHLDQASVYFGRLPHQRKENPRLSLPMLLRLDPVIETVRDSGSAALSLAYVACGRLDIAYHDRLNAWDMAAGVLMIEEIGGTVTDFQGKPITLASRDLIASSVSAFHAYVLKVAQEVMMEQCAGLNETHERHKPHAQA